MSIFNYTIHILFILSLLCSCSFNDPLSPEKQQQIKEEYTKINNEIATPIALAAASNCIHYFEKNTWPDINGIPDKDSVFENYIVKEANPVATFVKFKLKDIPYNWEMDIHIMNNNAMNCKVDTRGGKTSENMNLQVSYNFAVNDSNKTEDVIDDINNTNKHFLTSALLFYCRIDKCYSKEKPSSDWLNIIGSTITNVAMYALLGLTYGGYNY